MKKLILLLLTLFLVASISAQIYLPIPYQTLKLESFRHQSTYAIEDDLDNGIDGIDIFAVEGTRIFTNLSNLSSGEEQLGDNTYSDNTVVIGAISPIYKSWKATLLYGNANIHDSFFSSDHNINQWDSDADDVFDRLSSEYMYTSLDGSEFANCILLNIGNKMGKETEIAFTYKRMETKEIEGSEDSTYFTDTDIIANDILELWEGFGNEEDKNSIPINLYSLSYSMPLMDWKLRGDVYLMSGGEKLNGEELDYWFEDYEPYDPLTTETYLDSAIGRDQDEYTANLFGVILRLSDLNEYGVLWEVGGNFGMIFGSGDYQALDYTRTVTRSMIGTDVSVLDFLSRDNETAPISVSGMNMGINGRMEWQISENVRFGLGLMVNSLSFTREYDITESYREITDYDDGDGIPTAADFVITTTYGSLLTNTEKITMNSIVIPAGLEVCLGKNKDWFIRLGALATGSKQESTNTIEVDSLERAVVRTVYGDGTTTTVYGPSIGYTDEKDISSETYQSVEFAYGLGWKPSPNLSIDLIGMFDVNNTELLSTELFQSLRLSATIYIY